MRSRTSGSWARVVSLALVALLVLLGTTACKKDKDTSQGGSVGAPGGPGGSGGPGGAGDDGTAGGDAAEADGRRLYRLVAGRVTYSGRATRRCTFPEGDCGRGSTEDDRLLSLVDEHSTEATFTVQHPSADSLRQTEMILESHLDVGRWDHGFKSVKSYSSFPPCDSAVTFTAEDSKPALVGDAFVRVKVVPGTVEPTMTVSFQDVRVPAGVNTHVTESGACRTSAYDSHQDVSLRNPFDWYPAADRTPQSVPTRFGLRACLEGVCTYRTEGTDSWTYNGPYEGDTLTGGMTVRWWFDIEISGPGNCDRQYTTVEYGADAGMGQDLFALAASVPWCSDGDRAKVTGAADGQRLLFPDGTGKAMLLTVPLETYLGIEFQEKAGELATAVADNGSGSVGVRIDSPGFEACASPIDILLAVPPIKVAFGSSKLTRLSDTERQALLRNIDAAATLPEGVLRHFGEFGAVANDVFQRLLTATAGVIANQALENLDDASDVCVDTWTPTVTLNLHPDGTATADVSHDGNGVDATTHVRKPVKTV